MAVIVECEKMMKFAAIFLNYEPPCSSAWLFLDLKRLRFPPLAASMAERMVLLCVFETFCLKFCGISSVISIVTFFLRFWPNWCFGNVKTREKTERYFHTFLVPGHFMQISLRTFAHAFQVLSKVTIVASKQNSFTPLTRACLTTKLLKQLLPKFFGWIFPKWDL